jgi:hypothetical protein
MIAIALNANLATIAIAKYKSARARNARAKNTVNVMTAYAK